MGLLNWLLSSEQCERHGVREQPPDSSPAPLLTVGQRPYSITQHLSDEVGRRYGIAYVVMSPLAFYLYEQEIKDFPESAKLFRGVEADERCPRRTIFLFDKEHRLLNTIGALV